MQKMISPCPAHKALSIFYERLPEILDVIVTSRMLDLQIFPINVGVIQLLLYQGDKRTIDCYYQHDGEQRDEQSS